MIAHVKRRTFSKHFRTTERANALPLWSHVRRVDRSATGETPTLLPVRVSLLSTALLACVIALSLSCSASGQSPRGAARSRDAAGTPAAGQNRAWAELDAAVRKFGGADRRATAALDKLYEAYSAADDLFTWHHLLAERLDEWEASPEVDALGLAKLFHQLSETYRSRAHREFATALELCERALAIRQRVEPPSSPGNLELLADIASLADRAGDKVSGFATYERLLEILDHHPGVALADRFDTMPLEAARMARSLSGLGAQLSEASAEEQARALGQRVRARVAKMQAVSPPTLVRRVLSDLHHVFADRREYGKAEVALRAEIQEAHKTHVEHYPDEKWLLTELGGLLEKASHDDRAEAAYRRAVEIARKAGEPTHTNGALAALLVRRGKPEAAKAVLSEALPTVEARFATNNPYTVTTHLGQLAKVLIALDEYAEAERLLERVAVLNRGHPSMVESAWEIGMLYLAKGRTADAERLFARAKAGAPKNWYGQDSLLAALACCRLDQGRRTEAQSAVREMRPVEMLAQVTFASLLSEDANRFAIPTASKRKLDLLCSAGDAAGIVRESLRRKNLLADAAFENRRTARLSPRDDRAFLLRRRDKLIQRLLAWRLGPASDYAEAKCRDLEHELGGMEEKLNARAVFADHRAVAEALRAEVPQLQAVLPAEAAFVDFIHYERYRGRAAWERAYGAVIVRRTGDPLWIECGTEEEIDREIRAFHQAARGQGPETALEKCSRALHDRLIAPLLPHLEGAGTLIISPDAAVSFAALLDREGRFAVERFDFRYAASGRDLMGGGETRPASGGERTFVAIGDPEFSRSNSEQSKSAATRTRSVPTPFAFPGLDLAAWRLDLPPLPGARDEAASLAALAKARGWQAQIQLAHAATEGSLSALRSPTILHMATHGFFLSGAKAGAGREKSAWFAGGLALTGAQATLSRWAKGEVPSPESDGVLMAAEVAALDLSGTALVTLSACDTAAGGAKPGEGVTGLRSGFAAAGTRNLIVSLWPISDEETKTLMEDLYRRVFDGEDPCAALNKTQRERLAKGRESKDAIRAILTAGAFAASSRGIPSSSRPVQ
jgi:CHAT domain-containing protein/tetratricopeptide (TPR) repeat protein